MSKLTEPPPVASRYWISEYSVHSGSPLTLSWPVHGLADASAAGKSPVEFTNPRVGVETETIHFAMQSV